MSEKQSVKCLECGKRIELNFHCDIGDIVTCEHCYSDFEIISTNPVRIKTMGEENYIDDNYGDDDDDLDWDE